MLEAEPHNVLKYSPTTGVYCASASHDSHRACIVFCCRYTENADQPLLKVNRLYNRHVHSGKLDVLQQ